MRKTPFNLPPSWNAGYALPENVRDEGLRRRAFVTAQSPRGTYDNPSVGSAGYALPNYVKKEGYGQGAYTTKWAPRGSYGPPAVPHYLDAAPKIVGERAVGGGGVALTVAPLAGIDGGMSGSDLFTQFGARAAATIMRRVMALPASERRTAMKRMLDAMDPALFSRAERYANEAKAQGMNPRAALLAGLTRAIAQGMLDELEKSGSSRRAPQAHSLPGLGCYRARGALGAWSAATSGSIVGAGQITAVPQQLCDPPSGMTWDSSSGGFWRRLKAGETPKKGPCGGTVTTNTGPAASTVTTSEQQTARAGEYMQLGPSSSRVWFTIPIEGARLRITPLQGGSSTIARGEFQQATHVPSEIWNDIVAQIQKVSSQVEQLKPFSDDIAKMVDGAPYGLPGKVSKAVVETKVPIYSFRWPEGSQKSGAAGKRYGLYLRFAGSANAPIWELIFKNNEPDRFQQALSFLKNLVAKVINVVKDVVEEVADLACGLVNNPNAAAAAQQASGTGAAVGVGIAQGICGKGGAPPPPPTLPGGMDMNTVVLLGAGALVVVALAKRKRKKA